MRFTHMLKLNKCFVTTCEIFLACVYIFSGEQLGADVSERYRYGLFRALR